LQGHMRLASYVPGELIPLPLSGSIPELPHVAKVLCFTDPRFSGLYARRSNVDVGDHFIDEFTGDFDGTFEATLIDGAACFVV
jgi:hypothetical protein